MSIKKSKKIVIGFWIRLFADIIDVIILGVFGAIISLPLKPLFTQLGENGLWVGLCICSLYVGILQSKIGKGQSIAKRLLKIEVVRLGGGYLSIAKSFVRYIVVALIFYSSWIGVALSSIVPCFNTYVGGMVFAFATVFLFIGTILLVAFHPQKRGLQDYLAGSIVVAKGSYDNDKIVALYSKQKERKVLFIWLSFCLLLIIAAVILNKSHKFDSIRDLPALQNGIARKTDFTNINVALTFRPKLVGTKTVTTKTLKIEAFLAKNAYDIDSVKNNESKKLIEVIKSTYPLLNECEAINVSIQTGFNIGLAHSYYGENVVYDNDGKEISKNINTSGSLLDLLPKLMGRGLPTFPGKI